MAAAAPFCQVRNCPNRVEGGISRYCQLAHQHYNEALLDLREPSLVAAAAWTPGVCFARPPAMKVYFEAADREAQKLLTGFPQLPDPNISNTQFPVAYQDKLDLLRSFSPASLTRDEALDLKMLTEMEKLYKRTRDFASRESLNQVSRQTLNAFCQSRRGGGGAE